jgi:hypothetical protein
MQLLDREAELDALRFAKAGKYRPAQHVAVLGEAQLMPATALHVVSARFRRKRPAYLLFSRPHKRANDLRSLGLGQVSGMYPAFS